MVIKLYVSNTSGNVLMKLQQDHIKRILECKKIQFETIDVADPHRKQEKQFMQGELKLSDEDLVALPPQIFNDKTYRGDYSTFFTAVECEYLFRYLDLPPPPDEVEAQLKGGVLDLLQPSQDEVTEQIAHHATETSEVQEQIARHKPTETAL